MHFPEVASLKDILCKKIRFSFYFFLIGLIIADYHLILLHYHALELQKKVLVKVLQAARSGNDAEFCRLLQELRKTRKRKTRKSKDSKLGVTSTPLHSPDYIMADDDYYCQQQQQQPQQQSPYQWVSCYNFRNRSQYDRCTIKSHSRTLFIFIFHSFSRRNEQLIDFGQSAFHFCRLVPRRRS